MTTSDLTTSELTTPTAAPGSAGQVDLAIEGMTCASCVGRVEKRLGRLEGVTVTVNLATESARVLLAKPMPVADLVAAVEKAGYAAHVLAVRAPTAAANIGANAHVGADGHAGASGGAAVPAAWTETGAGSAPYDTSAPTRRRLADLRRRLIVALALGVPVILLSMVPAWQFPGWQWLVAALAAPIATWCAWPFHRSAVAAGRHGSSTMDTLVSLGVIASTGWSLWALLLGAPGISGCGWTCPSSRRPTPRVAQAPMTCRTSISRPPR